MMAAKAPNDLAATQEHFARQHGIDHEQAGMRMRESGAEREVAKVAMSGNPKEPGAAEPKPIGDKPTDKRIDEPAEDKRIETNPKLNDKAKTPGTGMLPEVGEVPSDKDMAPSG